jgi:hypothetical protein
MDNYIAVGAQQKILETYNLQQATLKATRINDTYASS